MANVTQSTELTQAMQTLRWLDEERRKDKATIAKLGEREQNLELQLARQAAQTQELQTALAGIQSVLSQASGFEEMVSIYKNELLLEMDQREQTRRKEQAESERLRRIEYETLTTNVNQLEKDMRLLRRHDERLNTLQAENQRLNQVFQHLEVDLADLRKRVEDPLQAVAYLEEQRRADNQRITELEEDTLELRGRSEALSTKFLLLEETLQKQRVRIDEAVQKVKEGEQHIEELRIADFQREQRIKKYLDQAEQIAQAMERLRVQTQGLVEQQQLVNRALSALEKLRARMERRQDEMAERQRLTEEQYQQRWQEWQTARAKERKKREVVIEERWGRQEQTNAGSLKRIETLQALTKMHGDQLDALWEGLRAGVTSLLKGAQDVYETMIAPIDEQLTILRSEQLD